MDTEDGQWEGWNWRSEGDVMVNGAFFVASGAGVGAKYGLASSVEPKSAALIDQLTRNAGVFGGTRSVTLLINFFSSIFLKKKKKTSFI